MGGWEGGNRWSISAETYLQLPFSKLPRTAGGSSDPLFNWHQLQGRVRGPPFKSIAEANHAWK